MNPVAERCRHISNEQKMLQVGGHKLLNKYQVGECTPEEKAIVEDYIIWTGITPQDLLSMEPDLNELRSDTVGPHLNYIKSRKTIRFVRIAAVAASIAILLGVGALIFSPDKNNQPESYANDSNDVDPGSDKAILTLANGTKINLSDARSGSLLSRSGIEIIKADDGTLVYKVAGSKSNTSEYNTITTPKGGQYKIVLPDGSKVWLNAASSLTYRTSLNNGRGERKVNLEGEGYFEVSKNKHMPFIVKTDKQEVIVLGTHFNINSYADEPDTKTTLLEGAVSISAPHGKKGGTILKPGDQAVNNGADIKIKKIDTSLVVAWKNNEFVFRNESLESIMRKVERWYDVEIVYENNEVGKETFGGTISRYDKISKVLSALEGTGDVKFKIKGRKILIMK